MSTIPPAEWARQRRVFTAFPSDAALWQADLEPARAEVAALVRQLAATVPVTLLADGAHAVAAAVAAVGGVAQVEEVPFGDIWLRDTGPIFRAPTDCARFRFNGWGGKYELAGDESVGGAIADLAGAAVEEFAFVLEGGAIEGDGQGLMLTTEQCLLNPNRNPGWDVREAERALKDALGARRVVWLGEGLVNDHTDGHVDNLARFVAPGTVAVPAAAGTGDANAAVYDDAARRLEGAGLVVHRVPGPGRVEVDGEVVPASPMNWVVANGQVIVPLYGTPGDGATLAAVGRLFPRHRVTGLRARAILSGGGSFHCITQQQPEDGR